MWGYGGWMHGGMGWPMLVGGGIWLLVMLAVVLALWAVLRPRETGHGQDKGTSAARQALDDRYVRGEIGREEYLEKRKDIEG